MISLLVPIDKFSFFVNTVLSNVFQYADVDFVFVTSSNQLAFDTPFKFRVARAPFDCNGNHLSLINWCLHNYDLNEWVAVQHCDMIWTQPWLYKVDAAIAQHPNKTLFTFKRAFDFSLDGKMLNPADDLFVAFHRERFLKYYKFTWGFFKDIDPSTELRRLAKEGRIRLRENCTRATRYGTTEIGDHVWLDGSESIGLESAANGRDDLEVIDIRDCFFHMAQFYRFYYRLKPLAGDTLEMPGQNILLADGSIDMKVVNDLSYFSFLTSYLFPKEEADRWFPWNTFKDLAKVVGFSTDDTELFCGKLGEKCASAHGGGRRLRGIRFRDRFIPLELI